MPVSDLFVPTVQPPDTPAIAGSLWFHVRGSHVWVAEAAARRGASDPVFLGMLGTTACWAVEVAARRARPRRRHVQRPAGPLRPPARRSSGRSPGEPCSWSTGSARTGTAAAAARRPSGRPRERSMKCPALRPPRLPPPGAGRHHAREPGRRGAAGPGRDVPRPDVLVHRRLRGAGRDARGGGEAGGPRGGRRRHHQRRATSSSQPWPFPHSLMLGFTADWAGGDIVIDPIEIVDAQWFRRRRPAADPARHLDRPQADRRLDPLGRRAVARRRAAAT